MAHAAELFKEGDENGDGTLSCHELLHLMRKVSCLCALICLLPCSTDDEACHGCADDEPYSWWHIIGALHL